MKGAGRGGSSHAAIGQAWGGRGGAGSTAIDLAEPHGDGVGNLAVGWAGNAWAELNQDESQSSGAAGLSASAPQALPRGSSDFLQLHKEIVSSCLV